MRRNWTVVLLGLLLALPGLTLGNHPLKDKKDHTKPGEPTRENPEHPVPDPVSNLHQPAEDCGLGTAIVYGFHPTYMDEARYYDNYNFKLLSHLSYFSYSVDCRTGQPQSALKSKLRSTGVIELARKKNPRIRIDLTLSMKSGCDSYTFLTNEKAINTCLDQLVDLMQTYQLDGICVDFEDINHHRSHKDSAQYDQFLRNLHTRIHQANPDAQLSVAGYASAVQTDQNLMTFRDLLDFVVVMGYDYSGPWSKKTNSVAPLKGGLYSLTGTINQYITGGMRRNQLVLALPYYGVEWAAETEERFADIYSLSCQLASRGRPLFRSMMRHKDLYQEHWLSDQKETYYTRPNPGTNPSNCKVKNPSAKGILQAWVPTTKAMDAKYDFIKEMGLAGTGMWALGYDNGYTELWDLLYHHFADCDPQTALISSSAGQTALSASPPVGTQQNSSSASKPVPTSGKSASHDPVLALLPENWRHLSWSVPLVAILGFLTLSIVALRSRKVREELFNRFNQQYLIAFAGTILLLLVHELLSHLFGRLPGGVFLIGLLAVGGSLLGYHFGRRWERNRSS